MNPADVASWISDAQSAFTAATDLEQLKSARLAHAGDKSPIALASRALGALSADQKASVGKIIGEAKAEIAKALAQQTAKLEQERDSKVLLEEVVDITLPVRRAHRGGYIPSQSLRMRFQISLSSKVSQLKKGQNLNRVGLTLMP